MKSEITLTFFLLCYALAAFTQAITPDQRQTIDDYIEQQAAGLVPGIAVGVVRDGAVIFEKYHGYASLQHQAPIDRRARFNIASVAKQFTALCVLKLVLEEKLNLEDDIRQYLPDFYPETEDPIKIKHLLNHSSGIRDFYDLMSIQGNPWWRQEGLSNKRAIALLARQRDLNFQPGSEYLYSNSNYTLLTAIVAQVSGQTFPEYAQELFRELGMNDTHFLEDYMYVIPHQALPYSDWGDGIWQQYPMMTNLHGDGFLFTTLADQLAYEQALQKASADDRLLSLSQQPIPDANIRHYGYGLEFNEVNGYPSVNHSGSTGSYHAQTMRFPNEKLSVVVMSNNGNIWSGSIARKIAAILLEPRESSTGPVSPTLPGQIQPRSPVTDLAGEYRTPQGNVIRIELQEEELYWRLANNNPQRLIHEYDNLYHLERDAKTKIVFRIGKDYESDFTVYAPGSEPKVHPRIPPFVPTREYLQELAGVYRSAELDAAFTFELTADNTLSFNWKEKNRSYDVEVIQEDDLLLFDYMMKVERNEFGGAGALSVTFNRVRNVRFKKENPTIRQPVQPTPDGGQISVGATKDSYGKGKGDILLTKTNTDGNEEWFKTFGGRSYDRAGSVAVLPDGYLIIGSTSSFGQGNYDVYVIRTDRAGREVWSQTYGSAGNEYGLTVEGLDNGGFLLKGRKQVCSESLDCRDYLLLLKIDGAGRKLWEETSETVLEY